MLEDMDITVVSAKVKAIAMKHTFNFVSVTNK